MFSETVLSSLPLNQYVYKLFTVPLYFLIHSGRPTGTASAYQYCPRPLKENTCAPYTGRLQTGASLVACVASFCIFCAFETGFRRIPAPRLVLITGCILSLIHIQMCIRDRCNTVLSRRRCDALLSTELHCVVFVYVSSVPSDSSHRTYGHHKR